MQVRSRVYEAPCVKCDRVPLHRTAVTVSDDKRFNGLATDRCGDKGEAPTQPPAAKLQRKYRLREPDGRGAIRSATCHLPGDVVRESVCGDEKQARGKGPLRA